MAPKGRGDSQNRVLPLVSDAGNYQLLVSWLEQHPEYESVAVTGGIVETDFDVCIVDEGAFREHFDALKAKKTAAAPLLLPYLLLVPRSGSGIIDTDAGRLADNVITDAIDEIVALPIQQAELHWRLSALRRLREQSLTLRERERKLEQQVDLFEKAQNIANVGAWEYDIGSGELLWTDEVYRIHALPDGTTPSVESSLQRYHPDDRPLVEEAFETAIETGEPYDVEARLIDAEDNERWVRTRGEPQNEDGELMRVRGTIQDITERKERERELQRIEQAVESAGHAIFITDPEGTIEYVNPAFETLTGYTQAEVVGETPHVLYSGEMPDEYYEDLWDTLLSGDVWEAEVVDRRKDGETYTAMQTVAPVTDGDDIHAFVAVQDDITARKEREETLERRRQAMDEAPVGISISDPNRADNPLIYVNDAFVAMTGYAREDILGENHSFLQGENTDPDTVARIREAIETEESISTELRCYRRDGAEFWDYLVVAPVKNDAGDVINYIQFHQDVTSRRQRQEQLEVLDRVLRHNLRNEMNVVRGYAESLQTETSGEPASFAGKIIETSDKLIEIAEKEREITDILRQEPDFEEIQLYTSLRTIVSGVRSDFPDATVTFDCPEDVVVHATTRFEQAIEELVTNAVVHNDSASPDVTVTVTQSDEAVHIDIADNGPSIPEMERNVLVNETEQTPLYHGGGLGLWLVNLIVARSEGTITVAENSPAGNIVSVRLAR